MAIKKGWSLRKLDVVCALNAFYQVILGPLASSTFAGLHDNKIINSSIKHGNLLITKNDLQSIKECHRAFVWIIDELNINFWALQANHYDDLIYCLASPKEEDERQ